MGNESIKLGISFSQDAIRFIEAEVWESRINITSIVQVSMPEPFDYTTIGDPDLIPQYAHAIDKSLENFNSAIQAAPLCLDRKLAIKKTFAVDKGLSEKEIRQHIEWELEQLLIAPRDEYNVGFEHAVLPHAKEDIIVFVALRKAIVNYIEEIFKKSRLDLISLDVDLFASIRALKQAYADKLKGLSALVEYNKTGIGFTLLLDGDYLLSDELPLLMEDSPYFEHPSDELAQHTFHKIQSLVDRVQDNIEVNLSRILLSGESADHAVLTPLEALAHESAVHMVEPFQNVHTQLNIESQLLADERPQHFLPTLGMILKP